MVDALKGGTVILVFLDVTAIFAAWMDSGFGTQHGKRQSSLHAAPDSTQSPLPPPAFAPHGNGSPNPVFNIEIATRFCGCPSFVSQLMVRWMHGIPAKT
jgi:hypothetical protein